MTDSEATPEKKREREFVVLSQPHSFPKIRFRGKWSDDGDRRHTTQGVLLTKPGEVCALVYRSLRSMSRPRPQGVQRPGPQARTAIFSHPISRIRPQSPSLLPSPFSILRHASFSYRETESWPAQVITRSSLHRHFLNGGCDKGKSSRSHLPYLPFFPSFALRLSPTFP